MDIKILNFKHVGLNILLYIMLVVVKSTSITEPQREVVSIYNDNFTTPASRPQYFIEVYRCVKVVGVHECDITTPQTYPVPSKTDEIEIVVPDITNRRNSSSNKYYKYVVYNHTSCRCGSKDENKERKLYGNKTEVSVTDFKTNYGKNPVNLIRTINACAKPQPRYKLHPKDEKKQVQPQFKYLDYEQCLPVCVATEKREQEQTTLNIQGGVINVFIKNDQSCQAYDGVITQPKSASQKASAGNSNGQDSNYEILVCIPSAKIILAAFLLSLILFTILIMDITLCRRKKGLLYALVCCRKDDADFFCQDCNEKRNEISV